MVSLAVVSIVDLGVLLSSAPAGGLVVAPGVVEFQFDGLVLLSEMVVQLILVVLAVGAVFGAWDVVVGTTRLVSDVTPIGMVVLTSEVGSVDPTSPALDVD